MHPRRRCWWSHVGGLLQLSAGRCTTAQLDEPPLRALGFALPLVIKPIRGRGSQGVTVVRTLEALRAAAASLLAGGEHDAEKQYGSRLMVEPYLPGEELTLAVMPPGRYRIGGEWRTHDRHWALPPVRRTGHHDGVTPYSGNIPVSANSTAMTPAQCAAPAAMKVSAECARAAELIGGRAPVRIDCRMSEAGEYVLFDLNMKPNMTGAGRPGRDGQDSLVLLAARAIGWSYGDLLVNMLDQAWS